VPTPNLGEEGEHMAGASPKAPSSVEEQRVEQVRLDNGLVLEIYDCSRPAAGNRWLVCFAARIEVVVRPDHLSDPTISDLSFEDLRRVVGEKAVYRYEKVRNFIDAEQKADVFRGLKENFLKTNLVYLSSVQFPRKLILRNYFDAQHPERMWRRQ
jgi:hypothetical protein